MTDRRSEQAMYEAQRLFQDRTDKLIEANTEAIKGLTTAIAQQGKQIGDLRASIEAQNVNIGRLERAVSDMVVGITAQRGTVDGLIRLCTTLVEQRAS